MSGITGGLNLRSSGIVNNSSATDGQVYTGTGAGLPVDHEAAAAGGTLLKMEHAYFTSGSNVNPWTSTAGYTATPYTITFVPTVAASKILIASSFTYQSNNSNNAATIAFKMYSSVDGYLRIIGDSIPWSTALTVGSGWRYFTHNFTFIDDKGSSTASRVYTIHSQTAGGNMALGLDNNRNTIMCMEIAN